jgi:hypothetical protein
MAGIGRRGYAVDMTLNQSTDGWALRMTGGQTYY